MSPGIYLEKRFGWQSAGRSPFENRSSVSDTGFWGLGSSAKIGKFYLLGAVLLGGSSSLSSHNNEPKLATEVNDANLGSAFGIRFVAGYEIFSTLFLHLAYGLTHYNSIEYPVSTDPSNHDTIARNLTNSISDPIIAMGISVVY